MDAGEFHGLAHEDPNFPSYNEALMRSVVKLYHYSTLIEQNILIQYISMCLLYNSKLLNLK